MSIILGKGQRGLLVGQTGSGKTWGAIYQLQHVDTPLVIVLDTKGEPAFNALPCRESESHEFYNSGDDAIDGFRAKKRPTYMIVRPSPQEISEPEAMDMILQNIYDMRTECLVYIDEAYQWHINGRAGSGLTGLLTRGRSMGISTLIATQRPAWISRFCLTEAQKFYIYKLIDKKDFKTVGELFPGGVVPAPNERYQFTYYDNSDIVDPAIYAAVPAPRKRPDITPTGRKWF